MGESHASRLRHRRAGLPALLRRLRLLGTIEDPAAIRAILDSLAAAERVDRAPPFVTLKPATLAVQV